MSEPQRVPAPPPSDTALRNGTPSPPARVPHAEISVSELCREYLADVSPDLQPTTLTTKTVILRMVAAAFGELPWDRIQKLELKKWIQSRGKSTAYHRDIYAVVRALFVWATDHGLIDQNPVAGLRFRQSTEEPIVTDFAALCTILRIAPVVYRRPWLFLFLTAARPKEICDARWDHWDRERSRLVIPNHKTQHRTGRPRIITLNSIATKLLEWLWRRRRPGDDRIFLNSFGRPWRRETLTQKFRIFRIRAGQNPKIRQYGLRHNAASESILSGNSDITTAALLGHATTQQLSRYCHVRDEADHLREAMERATGRKRR